MTFKEQAKKLIEGCEIWIDSELGIKCGLILRKGTLVEGIVETIILCPKCKEKIKTLIEAGEYFIRNLEFHQSKFLEIFNNSVTKDDKINGIKEIHDEIGEILFSVNRLKEAIK